MGSRLVSLIALVCLTFLPGAARPDDAPKQKKTAPDVVVRIRSIESIIADASYLGPLIGQEELVKQGVDLLKDRTTKDKGLDGIDVKKPLGAYAFVGPNGLDSYGAIMVPVKDEKTLLEVLGNYNLQPEKNKDGLYTIKDNPLKVPIFFRFANGYAYVTAHNDIGVAKDRLLAPADVLPANETALVSASIRLDQVPERVKEIIADFANNRVADVRESTLEGQAKTDAQKGLVEQASKETKAQIRSILNDGGALAIRVDIDQKKQDIAVTVSFGGKPGSKLAAGIAGLGQRQSLFAGLVGKDSAASLLVSYALPERIKKALGPTIDELVTALPSKAPDETHKKLFAKLLNALAPSLKAGEIDAAVDFRGPSANQHYTLVAGIKLANGEALEKAIKEIVADLPQHVRDEVKFDAQKAGNVNIHSVDIEHVIDDKAREAFGRMFGNQPLHFAVRSNAIFLAVGEDGLAALKHALTAQPGTAGMVRLDVAAARWVPLMAHDQPAAPKAAKEAFGKTPNDDRVQLSISGGTALKAELHIQAGILKFYNILKESMRAHAEN